MKIFHIAALDSTLVAFMLPLFRKLQEQGYEIISGGKNTGKSKIITQMGIKFYDIPFKRNLNPICLLNADLKIKKILKRYDELESY